MKLTPLQLMGVSDCLLGCRDQMAMRTRRRTQNVMRKNIIGKIQQTPVLKREEVASHTTPTRL